MCFARRISTILLAGAIAAPVVLTVPAKGAQPERKAQKKAVRRAQAENRVPERPAAMLERMKQQILALDLSADQKKQIEDLFA